MSSIPFGSRVVYLGVTKSGKTSAMLYLFYKWHKSIEAAYLWTHTDKVKPDEMAGHLPRGAVSQWPPGRTLGERMLFIEEFNMKEERAGRPNLNCHFIFDDCVDGRNKKAEHALRYLFSLGRRYATFHFTAQYPTALPPHVRQQASHLVIMYTTDEQYLDSVKELYLSGVNMTEFNLTWRDMRPYDALVYDRETQSFSILRPRNRLRRFTLGTRRWRQCVDAVTRRDIERVALQNLRNLF